LIVSYDSGKAERRDRMAKFKKGDKVKVRMDNPSPYRGRVGIVDRDPLNADSYGFSYMVKFESNGLKSTHSFNETDIEAAV
jgi:hypothetical protein